jgi:monoterpene epsilon-lactone hydrolase
MEEYVNSGKLYFAYVFILTIFLCVALSEKEAYAKDDVPKLESDGTLDIPALALPSSEYWSPEFKSSYINGNKVVTSTDWHLPKRTAPKSEWNKFDAKVDEYLAPHLVWDLKNYPVEISDAKIAGIRVAIISPKQGVADDNEHRVLINVHGGGFFAWRGLVEGELESIPVASIGGIKVITLDYREAPQYYYPAASEDVEAVYRQLLKQYKSESIGIFGCSAGGVLTSQATARFQAKGLPRPGAIGVFGSGLGAPAHGNPLGWASSVTGDSAMWNFGGGIWAAANRWYLQNAKADDPLANPESSDAVLSAFPPTLFLTGTRAFDMSQSAVSHAHLLKLKVDASLYVMEGAPHCAAFGFEGTPEAHDANAYIAYWFGRHLAL